MVVCGTIAMLRFPGVVYGTMTPLAPCERRQVTIPIFHSSEQGKLPIASLISKQIVPYQTRGSTCYPGMSTPKTRSLTDLSMPIHNTWRIPTVSTIPTHAQTTTSTLTMVTLHHDGWKTNTQHSTQAKLRLVRHCYLLSFYFLPYSNAIILSSKFFGLIFTFNIPGYITTSFWWCHSSKFQHNDTYK
jgi:hypothetical protein